MSRLTHDETAEPVSRDHILRRKHGQGNVHFTCSTDHKQDWQPYPVGPYIYYSCYMMCDHAYMMTFFILFYFPVPYFGLACVCVCFLPIHSGHQVRWTYQPGSHKRKVTQDF